MKFSARVITTALFLAATVLPAGATTGCAAVGWSDIHTDVYGCSLYYPAIAYLYDQGVVEGSPAPAPYGEGNRVYRPLDTVNRAEFAKIILGASKTTSATCRTQPFPDVPLNAWFAPYVCTAKDAGLIAGYPDGLFRPEQPVNVAEAAKILVHAFGLPFDPSDAQFDQEQNVWYRPYTEALREKNALAPSITANDARVTRGEMAEMAYRLMTGKTSADAPAQGEYDEDTRGLGKGFRDAEYAPDFVGASGEYFYFSDFPEAFDAAFRTTQSLDYFRDVSGTAKGFRFVHALQEERCGLSGLAEHCTPLTYDLDISLYNLPLDSGIVRRAIVEYGGGEDMVTERHVGPRPIVGTCVQLGIEGENTDYCTVPLSNNHTLLIVRNWIDTNVVMMPGVMPTTGQDLVFTEFLQSIAIQP